jgi:hypothetical protein
MATGYNVACGKCTKKYNIYSDIQQVVGERIVGVCPHCGEVTGYNFKNEFTFSYNAGDAEHGVGKHVEDEEPYDWDWLDYNKGSQKTEEKQFDQDDDLINTNLGWED